MINPKILIDTLLILRILLHCEHPVILRGRFRDSCVITRQVTQESKHKLLRWVCIRWICLTDSISLCIIPMYNSWLRLIVNIHQLWLNTTLYAGAAARHHQCAPAADLSRGGRERFQYRRCLDPFKLPKILQDSPSHRIFRHMYGALNVGKKITNCTVCL
jgi:hypothetical protein